MADLWYADPDGSFRHIPSGVSGPPWSGGPQNRELNLIPGEYIPGNEVTPDSVGVRENYGELTEMQPNASGQIYLNPGDYYGIRFLGSVRPNANGLYRFFDCEGPGKDPRDYGTFAEGAFQNTNDNAFFELYDCTIDGFWWYETQGVTVATTLEDEPGQPVIQAPQSAYSNGVRGRNIKMRRCEVKNFQDLVQLIGSNWDVQTSRLWRGFYMTGGVGSSADGRTHTDAVQENYGKHRIIKWNYIGGPRNNDWYTGPAPQINGQLDTNNGLFMIQNENMSNPATQYVDDFLIEENWLAGGNTGINLNLKNGNDLSGLTIRNNRFLRTGTLTPVRNDAAGHRIYNKVGLNPTITGNVWWDWDGPITGSADPVPIHVASA